MSFTTWSAYQKFAHEVRTQNRYILSEESKKFLADVERGAIERQHNLPAGTRLWRAQLGCDRRMHEEDGIEMVEIECPHPESRMFPQRDRATEGRVNPRGIPCFYGANDKTTALSEVRPCVGEKVSVGCFHTRRSLRIVDCSNVPKHLPFYFNMSEDGESKEPDQHMLDQMVWGWINLAFSKPTDNDHGKADYAPTQMIAEVWRQAGFDGIGYKSKLGPGKNIALFDLDAVEVKCCELHEVEAVTFTHRECANGWFKRDGAARDEMTSLYISSIGPQ